MREYIERFRLGPTNNVLDPFCGTGTTLVECKKLGIPSVGVESNPMACFASKIKVDWNPDPDALLHHASEVARLASCKLEATGVDGLYGLPLFNMGRASSVELRVLPLESLRLLLKDSISPLPLHKTLVLLDTLRDYADERFDEHERIALARSLISVSSNLHFGPEVGVGPAKSDAPVIQSWVNSVSVMADDLRKLSRGAKTPAFVHCGDSRRISNFLQPKSVDAVITSPPYPNEKDYTRTTRLESVLLGFIHNKQDLRAIKQNLIRSNTRNVFQNDTDDLPVAEHPEISRIADAIEKRRNELHKTSGFERLYARVTKLYFGGMATHLSDLRTVLRPGAHLAYVVGDQASYLQVMIRTGQLLADIAQSLKYEVIGIDLFRTRLATATRQQLREEVVVLRWPGSEFTGESPE